MPARKPSRRAVPQPDENQWRKTRRLTVECASCSLPGSWDPVRGVVLHPLRPNCRVQIIRDEPGEVAA